MFFIKILNCMKLCVILVTGIFGENIVGEMNDS